MKTHVDQPKDKAGVSNCRIVVPACDRGYKSVTHQMHKALFNWEVFAKHDHLRLSDISLELFLIQIV